MTTRTLPDFLLNGDATLGVGQRPADPPAFAGTGRPWHRRLPELPERTSTDQASADAHANLAWQWHVQEGRIGGG